MREDILKALDEADAKIDEVREMIGQPPISDGGGEGAGFVSEQVSRYATVKVDVPVAVYRQLRINAAARGVTSKYLLLELLASGGYDIDLSQVPTDGRRGR
jgi:hypothetical protein